MLPSVPKAVADSPGADIRLLSHLDSVARLRTPDGTQASIELACCIGTLESHALSVRHRAMPAFHQRTSRLTTNRQNRRHLVTSLCVATLMAPTLAAAQAPPPPPPGTRRAINSSAILPSAATVLSALRNRVELSSDEATELNRVLTNNFDRQRSLLASFGLDPAYDSPDTRLSGRDARDLLDELEDLVDSLATAADRILAGRQRSAFHDIVRQEQAKQRNAITALIR